MKSGDKVRIIKSGSIAIVQSDQVEGSDLVVIKLIDAKPLDVDSIFNVKSLELLPSDYTEENTIKKYYYLKDAKTDKYIAFNPIKEEMVLVELLEQADFYNSKEEAWSILEINKELGEFHLFPIDEKEVKTYIKSKNRESFYENTVDLKSLTPMLEKEEIPKEDLEYKGFKLLSFNGEKGKLYRYEGIINIDLENSIAKAKKNVDDDEEVRREEEETIRKEKKDISEEEKAIKDEENTVLAEAEQHHKSSFFNAGEYEIIRMALEDRKCDLEKEIEKSMWSPKQKQMFKEDILAVNSLISKIQGL